VVIVRGKGNKIRTIPLNQIAFDVLKERLRVRHICGDLVFPSSTGTKIQKQRLIIAFKKAVKQAGIDDFTFHDLRHTFATRLAQSGVDLYAISRLLGHNDISTTQRYAHHSPESLRNSVEVLEKCYNFTTFGVEGKREQL
jgi:site-specific recombinase XerD